MYTPKHAPAGYVDKMVGAIVGIEIEIRSLAGKWKLSQNRPAHDRESIAEGLEGQSDPDALEVARLMRRACSSLMNSSLALCATTTGTRIAASSAALVLCWVFIMSETASTNSLKRSGVVERAA